MPYGRANGNTAIPRLLLVAVCWLALLVSGPLAAEAQAPVADPEPTNDALAAMVANPPAVRFSPVRDNPHVDGVSRQLVSFEVDELTQYALVLRPPGEAPPQGWPLLIYNHGFHPDPPAYGKRTADGVDDRPGDYYRGVPQAYALNGYLVVVPDYRGHNQSQGAEFTRRALATYWYVRDVIGAYFAAVKLDGIDPDAVYMTGHSMGGYITQRALIALGGRIAAASIWSTSGEDVATYLYSMDLGDSSYDGWQQAPGERISKLAAELAELSEGTGGLRTLARLRNLQTPLLIHHARDDESTAFWGSLAVASRLRLANKPFELVVYEGSDHLFTGADMDAAIQRDLAWFAGSGKAAD
jgi:dipeptidyl aminopeptidase/acylaminoacyl peptidase